MVACTDQAVCYKTHYHFLIIMKNVIWAASLMSCWLMAARCVLFSLYCVFIQRAICYRPSVRLYVCLSVTRVDQSKTVEVRILQFLPYGSPMPLVFAKLHPEILRGSPRTVASNTGGVGKSAIFQL